MCLSASLALGSQPPGWEPGAASSSLPCFGKLVLPGPHSQTGDWERANK